MGVEKYKDNFEVRTHEDALKIPYTWKHSKVVFVNSMSDLFHKEIPLEFITPEDRERYYGRNVTLPRNEPNPYYNDGVNTQPIIYYLSSEYGGDGNSQTTRYAQTISRPDRMNRIIREIVDSINKGIYSPILSAIDNTDMWAGNTVTPQVFWATNPRVREFTTSKFYTLIKKMFTKNSGIGGWRSLSTYENEPRLDEPGNDDMIFTSFEVSPNNTFNLNQGGIYIWVLNGTQVKYVGKAGNNQNNLAGRVDKYARIGLQACSHLGTNCRVNNYIANVQNQIKIKRRPNESEEAYKQRVNETLNKSIRWFVVPLTDNEIREYEQPLIRYFGTKINQVDPFLDPANYRTIEANAKTQARSATNQGKSGVLNRA
jgi:hypothetical protein